MWCIFDETRCRQDGWLDAYQSYFREYDVDPLRPVLRVKGGMFSEYAHFNLVNRNGELFPNQYLTTKYFYPINDKPIEEGEYL